MKCGRLLARLLFALLSLALFLSMQLSAQTSTTGDIDGVVTDPTGAVVANAAVTLKNLDNGASQSAKTNADGSYKFALLKPGNYSVGVEAAGFQSATKRFSVALGAAVAANIQLAVSSSQETVEVTSQTASVETENADLNTNFDARQVALLPNPGNDLSAVALTTPGAVMNTAGGSQFGGGNFEVYGLPATSNVFTYDGANDNDPYFNINNSGATNLTLGLNDVQETSVVANGYSGQYGGLAGADINYVSKSGSNAFHGNLEYWWNGRTLNANTYFRNQANLPRNFVNANQYAGSIGGPIKKDKAFFFFDYEGIRLLIPSPFVINLPTQPFENAVIQNLNTSSFNGSSLSASVPFYQNVFKIFNGTPGASNAQNILNNGGCSNVTTLAGVSFGTSNPCALQLQAGLSSNPHDYLAVWRYDQNIGNNDKFFVRVQHEHGFQPTYTDPINPAFNYVSDQPQWQSQLSETHTFGTSMVNNFVASMNWYSALFAIQSLANSTATLPLSLTFNDTSLANLNPGYSSLALPQGRNVSQYQFVDDFNWARGRHTFKAGLNFRRDDISDHNFANAAPLLTANSLADFANGFGGTQIVQNFPSKTEVPIALYQLGAYVGDDLKVTPNLKLTLSFRFDHLSNPVCQTDCFQRLSAPFADISHTGPLNQTIQSGLHTAFPSVTGFAAEPKIGFAWSPFGSTKTVVRGGFGVFADSLPTGAIDSFLGAAPLAPGFGIGGGALSPVQPGSLTTLVQAANASFRSNYASGLPLATPITFYNSTAVKVPRYYEWSLEVQHSIGWNTTLSTMYVGNHGSHEEISNGAANAWSPTPFGSLPTTVPDARFGNVAQAQNIANSNYAGLIVTAKHSFNAGFQFQASYTFSHALDEISNNSLSPFGLVNLIGTNADIIFPQDPNNIRKYNYGNADYDIRHNFTMNYVWGDALRHLTSKGPNALMKGWTASGTIFRHSGLPLTVFSINDTFALAGTNYGNVFPITQTIFSNITGPTSFDCSGQAAKLNNPCWNSANFADPVNNFGQQRRNSFRGPGYFDTDFSVEKGFGIPKWEGAEFSIGARFFNLFNHPNFGFPSSNSDDPTHFGRIFTTANTPTSIYGSGLGADSSPRLIQLQGKITF
jgi:hypothetical protein